MAQSTPSWIDQQNDVARHNTTVHPLDALIASEEQENEKGGGGPASSAISPAGSCYKVITIEKSRDQVELTAPEKCKILCARTVLRGYGLITASYPVSPQVWRAQCERKEAHASIAITAVCVMDPLDLLDVEVFYSNEPWDATQMLQASGIRPSAMPAGAALFRCAVPINMMIVGGGAASKEPLLSSRCIPIGKDEDAMSWEVIGTDRHSTKAYAVGVRIKGEESSSSLKADLSGENWYVNLGPQFGEMFFRFGFVVEQNLAALASTQPVEPIMKLHPWKAPPSSWQESRQPLGANQRSYFTHEYCSNTKQHLSK